jgi:hypothetical protein
MVWECGTYEMLGYGENRRGRRRTNNKFPHSSIVPFTLLAIFLFHILLSTYSTKDMPSNNLGNGNASSIDDIFASSSSSKQKPTLLAKSKDKGTPEIRSGKDGGDGSPSVKSKIKAKTKTKTKREKEAADLVAEMGPALKGKGKAAQRTTTVTTVQDPSAFKRSTPSFPAPASVPVPPGPGKPAKPKSKKRKQVEEDDEFRDSRGTGPSTFLFWPV